MKKLILILTVGLSTVTFQSFKNIEQKSYTKEQVTKGKYLVEIMGCRDCHSPKKMTPQGPAIDFENDLSGHPSNMPLGKIDKASLKDWVLFNMMNTAAVGPWGVSYSANLTPHETGIGNWTEEQFIRALKEGKSKGLKTARPLLPPMPWQNYVNLKNEDVVAMLAYLKSIKPIDNLVPQPLGPDKL